MANPLSQLLRGARSSGERSRRNQSQGAWPTSSRRPLKRLGAAAVILLIPLAAVGIVLATPPEASFTVSDSTPTVGDSVTFTSDVPDPDVDGDTIQSIEWDFDDGTTDSGPNPSHVYDTPGTKTVRMKVTDSADEITERTEEVSVSPPPNQAPRASFTIAANAGRTVVFDGSGSDDPDGDDLTYEWEFDGDDDFDDSTSDRPTRVYSTSGDKTVKLRVSDGDLTDETSGAVTVENTAPTASFTFSPPVPLEGETVDFDGSGSDDPDGDSLTYAWELDGDNDFNDSPNSPPTAKYSDSGPHIVSLRVSDGELTDETSQTVNVNEKPKASFTFAPAVPLVGQPISLDGRGSEDDKPIADYRWDFNNDGDFDDATDATGANPTHPGFPTRGEKKIKLQVTDSDGVSAETSRTVRVNAPPVAKIVFSPEAPTKDAPVNLSGGSSTDAEKAIAADDHDWDLDGDGQFDDAQGKGVVHRFSAPGIQHASLQVTDSDKATHIHTVRINRKPTPSFISNNETPITNESITFAETATDIEGDETIRAFAWDVDGDGFDDGSGRNATHAFATAGAKTVKLRVTDDVGASEVATVIVQVENTRPDAAFGFSPDAPLPGQLVIFSSSSHPTAGKGIVKQDWDLDNDRQFDDASGPSVNYSFASPGIKYVALRVEEEGGGFDIVSGFLVVNAAPGASFTSSPGNPFESDGVTFSSTSADPDGPLASQQWDLDDDGRFDDASGEAAIKAFAKAGAYTVRLQVTDSRGAVATASATVTVIARPLTPLRLPWEFNSAVRRISPFTTRVNLLSVRAPSGATVTVRCKGRSCPDGNARRKGRQRLETSTRGRGARKLRFRRLERKYRPGTKIIVSATKLGFIGKQQTWIIRRRQRPLHREQCLYAEGSRASACPPS